MRNRIEIVKEMIVTEYRVIADEGKGDQDGESILRNQAFDELNRVWKTELTDEIIPYNRGYERLIVFFKRIFKKAIGWYVQPYTQRQQYFNMVSVRSSNSLNDELNILRTELKRKSNQISSLEGKIDQLSRQVLQLKNQDKMDLSTLDFYDAFRGDRNTIMERLAVYRPFMKGREKALDVRCGRGEMIELLESEGILATGIDSSREAVGFCFDKGLSAMEVDELEYLTHSSDQYDLVCMIHVLEHFHPRQIEMMLRGVHHMLPDRGILIIENHNPRSLSVFRDSFYMDPTHVKPLHPFLLRFVAEQIGFTVVEYVELNRTEKFEDEAIAVHVRDSLFSANEYGLVLMKENNNESQSSN